MREETAVEQLTQQFLEGIKCFEQQVQQYQYQQISFDPPSTDLNAGSAVSFCIAGFNRKTTLMLSILRCLHQQAYTIIAAQDLLSPTKLILVVQWGGEQKEYHRQNVRGKAYAEWMEKCVWGTQICVRQPFKRNKLYIVPLRNVLIKVYAPPPYDSSALKQQGNLFIHQKKYFQALLSYEMALALINQSKKYAQRAILYSNSSLCLFQMRLFENALTYAQIAIRVNPRYSKGFFRKLMCLLQMRLIYEIPHCIMRLSQEPTIQSNEKAMTENKLYNYMANFTGLFNWKYIFKQNSFNHFGEYTSQKLQINPSQIVVVKTIKPYELLFVTKPLIHSRMLCRNNEDIFQVFVEQIMRCCYLQSSFNEQIQWLPVPQQSVNREEQQQLSVQMLREKVQSNLFFERTIQYQQSQMQCGLYPSLSKLTHNCHPNCSILYIKGAVGVFSCREIKPCTHLSIDFAIESRQEDRAKMLKLRKNIQCECDYCSYPFREKMSISIGRIENSKKETPKIRKEIIWSMILANSSFISREMYQYMLNAYALAVDQEPTWDAVLNLAHVTIEEMNEELKKKCRGVVIRAISKYLRVTLTVADQILTDMRK